ncbi:MAG: LON peptidase substrate-binding domain-containing protein, partial [Flavobacteriales bacterium]
MDEFNIQPMIAQSLMDDETEFIPLLTSDDDENINSFKIPKELPLLPLKNTVLFPGVVIPITVGRDKSIKLIQEAYRKDKIIAVVSQKDNTQEEPTFNDLNKIGSVGVIMKVLRMPDGNTTVIIQGKKRIEVTGLVKEEPYMVGTVQEIIEAKPKDNNKNFDATVSSLKDLDLQIIKQSPHIPSDAAFAIKNIESPSFLINFVASN